MSKAGSNEKPYTREDIFMGGPGLRAYAFNTSLYCEDCARKLEFAKPGEWRWSEIDFSDSEQVPQPCFFPESETEQYCDDCGEYLYGGNL